MGLALGSSALAQGAPVACRGQPGVPAWAGPGVFWGTLGGGPVALRLGPGDDGERARYFYERRGVNITLVPTHQRETLLLREEVWTLSGTEVTGCLRLERAGTGLRGSWTSPDGKRTLPVTLAPLDVTRLPLNLPDSPGLRKLRASDPLAFLKLNRAWVKEAGVPASVSRSAGYDTHVCREGARPSTPPCKTGNSSTPRTPLTAAPGWPGRERKPTC